MEIQPNVSIISYIRLAFLTTLLFFVDFLYVSYVIALSYTYGPSVQILFGFEVCIIISFFIQNIFLLLLFLLF